MRWLILVDLQAKTKHDQKPIFLEYAAYSWLSHLLSMSIGSDQSLTILYKLLKGHGFWPGYRALQLTISCGCLSKASKHLSKFSPWRKYCDARRNANELEKPELELCDSWAVDFMKVVASKPPSDLQPHTPILSTKLLHLSIVGEERDKVSLSDTPITEDWDDSLARLSLGFGNLVLHPSEFLEWKWIPQHIVSLADNKKVGIIYWKMYVCDGKHWNQTWVTCQAHFEKR